MLSQGISSASNMGVSLVAARYLSETAFGAFAAAYAAYVVITGLMRAMIGEATLVRSKNGDSPSRDVLASVFAFGIIAVGILAVAQLAVVGDLQRTVQALAVALMPMLILDAGRYLAFSKQVPAFALSLDVIWALPQIVLLGVLIATNALTPTTAMAAWGCSAALGALAVILRVGLPRPSIGWVKEQWGLSGPYTAEWFVSAGVAQLSILLLGVLAGLEALGSIRGASVLFGPLNVLYMGMIAALVPANIGVAPGRLLTQARGAAAFMAGAAVLLLAMSLALPPSLGSSLLGATWESANPLFLAVGLAALFNGIAAGAAAGLRSLRAAKATLRLRMISAPLMLGASVTGAVLGSANGFAWGTAMATAATAILWWRSFLAESGGRSAEAD